MILSDSEIKEYIEMGKLKIEPFKPELQISEASVELTLSNKFRVFKRMQVPYLDLLDNPKGYTELIEIPKNKPFILHPGEFVLGATREYIEMPTDLIAFVDGKSSLGRLGLAIHMTASLVDPGFRGTLTLEIANFGKMPITLYEGMPVCKLIFMKLSKPASRPYFAKDSKYLGQREPKESSYGKGLKEFLDKILNR